MNQDLNGKVILITGGTDGIGKAAATDFARRGAHLTLIGRNPEKTEQVVRELRAKSGNPDIAPLICDLSRLADVRHAAAAFRARHQRLDVLANNAGAMFPKPAPSVDGFELSFALNHLAHFQLTNALLDLIRSTPGARVISTSSAMQGRGHIDLATTPTNLSVSGPAAYAASKLANILFTRELQRRLAGTSATANCFHPGVIRSQFGAYGSDFGFVTNLIFKLSLPFAKTPEQGADTLIWLATSAEAASLRGQYLSNRRPLTPSKQAQDDQLAADLWTLSEELCAQAAARGG